MPTSKQAQSLWCPMVRHGSAAHNSDTLDRNGAFAVTTANHCIGERCAMWRIHSPKNETGYCGLAGPLS